MKARGDFRCARGLLPALLPALLWSASAVAGELPPEHIVSRMGEAMGTVVEMKVWARDDEAARAAIARAFGEIARLELLMTTWREDSDVSKVNAAAGVAPVAVGPETFDCVKRSLEFSRLSGGAFDVTFYSLKGLWKFDQDLEPRLPDPKLLEEKRRLIDYVYERHRFWTGQQFGGILPSQKALEIPCRNKRKMCC